MKGMSEWKVEKKVRGRVLVKCEDGKGEREKWGSEGELVLSRGMWVREEVVGEVEVGMVVKVEMEVKVVGKGRKVVEEKWEEM